MVGYCVILDILLAIQQKTEDCTQKMLDTVAGDGFGNVALQFLGAKVGHRLWEGVIEAAAEHDDELHAKIN